MSVRSIVALEGVECDFKKQKKQHAVKFYIRLHFRWLKMSLKFWIVIIINIKPIAYTGIYIQI